MEQINFKEYEAEQESAAEQGAAHYAHLIRAALPYLNSDLQKPLDLLVKGMEFMEAAKGFRLRESLSALNVRDKALVTDMDGLLSEVSKVANPSELKMINLLAGFKNIRKFYETYQALAPLMSGFGGQSTGDPGESQSQPFSGGDLFSDPSSLMKMANMMQMFQSMNASSPSSPTPEPFPAPASPPPAPEPTFTSGSAPAQEPPYPFTPVMKAAETAAETRPADPFPPAAEENSPKEPSTSGSMFDLLSAFVPPEQKSTFETLKLLLSSGAAQQTGPQQTHTDEPAPEPQDESQDDLQSRFHTEPSDALTNAARTKTQTEPPLKILPETPREHQTRAQSEPHIHPVPPKTVTAPTNDVQEIQAQPAQAHPIPDPVPTGAAYENTAAVTGNHPFGIPSDIDAYSRSYYNGFDQMPGIYRGGLIDPTAAAIETGAPEENAPEEYLPESQDGQDPEKNREAS